VLAVELEIFTLFSSSYVKLLLLLSNVRLRFVVLVLQHAARYLANQEWVKNDSLKTVENTAVMPLLLNSVIFPFL
jgi:hypothetical protein